MIPILDVRPGMTVQLSKWRKRTAKIEAVNRFWNSNDELIAGCVMLEELPHDIFDLEKFARAARVVTP